MMAQEQAGAQPAQSLAEAQPEAEQKPEVAPKPTSKPLPSEQQNKINNVVQAALKKASPSPIPQAPEAAAQADSAEEFEKETAQLTKVPVAPKPQAKQPAKTAVKPLPKPAISAPAKKTQPAKVSSKVTPSAAAPKPKPPAPR